MNVSIVIPVYNERENVRRLWADVHEALSTWNRPFEIIFVDDGSRDGTREELQAVATADPCVKLILLRRNFGQTAALQAGIHHATFDVIVTMDGDLQNDPRDIPMMVEKLDEGYDLVHGWRQQRQDTWLDRKLPSLVANWLISKTTRFPIHDLGCTLKAIRREIAQELELYGEMHRFIPILAHQRGARCVEVLTRHRARQFGATKYGIGRTFRVLLDLLTVKYLLDYFPSPMKLFGKIGLLCSFASIMAGIGTFGMKFFDSTPIMGNPLLMLAAFSALAAIQFFSFGLIGEVCARIYYTAQPKQNYAVHEFVNFEDEETVFMTLPLRHKHRRAA